ncbi:MAG: RsmD family RNA methyltransferase [Sphingomonadaceae bacterium]|uniref:RsmD family RNA methyltransferase n=1 Tax=Thermaurantiacus sp. TaxID=2820283 RepID=UPI00298EDE8B|nr:RsmD family RNA methyltransferase [Thermaurantiacus sp.]MCS6987627.1 RsmD family RNA methyltransferase [Sphingomonadaceae bacterium]MDW8415228.1 RsmD family RNA methyltransferase [Thermaurantiacus sp.]
MRIVAGRWRSRRLVAPEGRRTRPTADRVRETLFAMLGSRLGDWAGLAVLDLFAGSGALALEALSRGAAEALLIDTDPAARRAAEANIRALGAPARVWPVDATRLPPAPRAFGLVLADPPWGRGLAGPALVAALAQGWIAPGAWVAVETGRAEDVDVPGLEPVVTRAVAASRLHLLRRS